MYTLVVSSNVDRKTRGFPERYPDSIRASLLRKHQAQSAASAASQAQFPNSNQAPSLERMTENQGVASSNLALGTRPDRWV